MLQLARAKGCVWNGTTITEAALNGHRDVFAWAVENGCPHLEMLQYRKSSTRRETKEKRLVT